MIHTVCFVMIGLLNFGITVCGTDIELQDEVVTLPVEDSGVCSVDVRQLSLLDAIAFDGYGCELISPVQFPKATAFLESIVKKYPDAFLDVKIVMSRMPYPQASAKVIHMPYNWLLELEAQIPQVQKWTEWTLLHEAGHIKRQHVLKNFVVQKLIHVMGIGGIAYLLTKSIKTKQRQYVDALVATYVIYCSAFIFFPILYSRFVMEPEADDFAAQTCQSVEALEMGALFLGKCTMNNAMYPTVQSRIDKIYTALLKRFGKKYVRPS